MASRIRGWRGRWDRVWDNIKLRAEIEKALVDAKRRYNLPQILEASFVVQANDAYHLAAERVNAEHGELVSDEIYRIWEAWLKKKLKSIK